MANLFDSRIDPKNYDFLQKLLGDSSPNSLPKLDLSSPDISGTKDIDSLIKDAKANANRDQDVMNNLPDISGTNDILNQILNKRPSPLASNESLPTEISEIEPTQLPAPKNLRATVRPDVMPPLPASTPEQTQPTTPESTPEASKELSLEEKMTQAAAIPAVDQEMIDAQDQERRNLGFLSMLEGSQMIGAGFARQAPIKDYAKSLEPLATHGVKALKESRASKELQEKQARERQSFVLDTEKGKLEFAKAKMGMDDAKQMNDPSSSASQLARASTIDALNRMGRKDLASRITDKMPASQIDKLFGTMNLSNMTTAYEAQQNRLALAKQSLELKKAVRDEKLESQDVKRLDTASKLIAADLARNNTAFGRNANIIRSSDAIEALVSNKDPKDVTPQQMFEIAKSLDAMLSAGGTTMTGTEHLMPKGAMVKYANIAEFFKNEPQAARQGGYVKQAMDTIKRERALAQQKIKQTSGALLGSYMDLSKKHPESWNTMLQMHGINPEEVGISPSITPTTTGQYSAADEAGISAVMKNNSIDRATAIKALKDAGKIK